MKKMIQISSILLTIGILIMPTNGQVSLATQATAEVGGYTLWTYTDPTDYILRVAVGDLNDDGVDDALAGGRATNVYAIDGGTGATMWTYPSPSDKIDQVAVGDFNGDGVDDALAGSWDTTVYAIAGAAPPLTKLDVRLSVSKTYVDIASDWTLARAVVTNVGAFPAYSVWVIFHAPDGTDNATYYQQINHSRSKTVIWNLTNGNGLPTVKIPSAMQISYTISVEVRAVNCPTELVDVAIIVDPPIENQYNPLLLAGIFCVPLSIGVVGLVSYWKWRRKFSK